MYSKRNKNYITKYHMFQLFEQEIIPRESAYTRTDVTSVIPTTTTKKLFLTKGDGEGIYDLIAAN